MIQMIRNVYLRAVLGEQTIQLVIPATDLETVLRVLNFNKATEVSYSVEVRTNEPTVAFAGTYIAKTG